MYCNFSGSKMGHFDPFWSILIHFWGSNLDPPFSLICVVNTGSKRTQIWFILEVLFHHIYRTGHWTCFKKWVISWNLEYFWIFLDIFGSSPTQNWKVTLEALHKGYPKFGSFLGHTRFTTDPLPFYVHDSIRYKFIFLKIF